MNQKQIDTGINFAPLNDLKSNTIQLDNILLAIGILGALYLGLYIAAENSPIFAVLSFFIAFFGVVGIIVYVVHLSRKNDEACKEILLSFASVNQFSYQPSRNDADERLGTIFNHGHSKQIKDMVEGQFGAMPFEHYNYQYTTGSGKNSTTHDLHVLEITLPRQLPHLIIDSLVEANSHLTSTLPIEFDSSQRITLEGDFSKYFHLYAPDKYGITALTILAPDAMQTLLDFAAMCDIEIIGNKLYFYWSGRAYRREDYENSFQTAGAVLEEIGGKLATADIYASKDHAAIHSAPGQSEKLRKSWLSKYGTALFVLAFGLYFLVQFTGVLDQFIAVHFILYAFVFISPFVFLISRSVKRSRLKADLARRYR